VPSSRETYSARTIFEILSTNGWRALKPSSSLPFAVFVMAKSLMAAFSIVAALSLEASGFVEDGQSLDFAKEGNIGINGSLPCSTRGGLKARGHPVGASGVYQVVEAVEQLRGQAGDAQVKDCRVAMTQSVGGLASVAVTHILGN